MYLRKHKADAALLSAVDPPMENPCEPPTIRAEQAEAALCALNCLALAHREVLTLFFLQDLSLDDIARVLDVPVGTIKSHLHYAKQALRETLEKENVR